MDFAVLVSTNKEIEDELRGTKYEIRFWILDFGFWIFDLGWLFYAEMNLRFLLGSGAGVCIYHIPVRITVDKHKKRSAKHSL